MHLQRLLPLFLLALLMNLPLAEAAIVVPADPQETEAADAAAVAKKAADDFKKMERKDRRAYRKAARRKIKDTIKEWKKQKRQGAADTDLLLLVIIGILIPPLAMYLYDGGATDRFWISFALTVVGILLWTAAIFFGTLPAIVYTLYIILSGQ